MSELTDLARFNVLNSRNCDEAAKDLLMQALADRIEELEKALREIMAYDPGNFRSLVDEIAIWKIAKTALGL